MADQNPTIAQAGTASITAKQYCTWNTANGQQSTLTISNSSRANILKIAISGAPGSGIIVQLGDTPQPSVDGIFSIPPNQPNFVLTAFGDFGGSKVTISNITNTQNDASADITAVVAS